MQKLLKIVSVALIMGSLSTVCWSKTEAEGLARRETVKSTRIEKIFTEIENSRADEVDDRWSYEETTAGVRTARVVEFSRGTPSQDPRFVTPNNTVVEAQVGSTAVLHCKTSSTTGGLVSWIRKKTYQLLTVGLHSHSSDERFSINYVHWDWQLHIRYVQPRDAGAYECQVSSHPPASIFVHLEVVEAEAEILGAPEKHVKSGSILRLVCILHHTTEAPKYVFWYKGNEMINYNEGQSVVVESDEHTSVLIVTKASRRHSGNYTCAPSNAKPASILVHILNGEYPAAMQHGESSTWQTISVPLVICVCILHIFFLFHPVLSITPQIALYSNSPSAVFSAVRRDLLYMDSDSSQHCAKSVECNVTFTSVQKSVFKQTCCKRSLRFQAQTNRIPESDELYFCGCTTR